MVAQFWFRRVPNAGDAVAPEIVRRVSGARPVWVPMDFEGKIVGTGSIAHAVRAHDVVVGAGAIEDEAVDLPRSATVLSVRGPMTRRCLGEARVPEVYGDPGLLVADLFPDLAPVREPATIGVVPHYVDEPTRRRAADLEDVVVLDPRGGLVELLARVRGCRVVLSSSLHGIVFAESFGVPALWIEPVDEIVGGRFKFVDYYLGTGRDGVSPLSFEHALERARSGAFTAPEIDTSAMRAAFAELDDRLG